MKRKFVYTRLIFLTICVLFLTMSATEDKSMKETALFKVDTIKKEIVSLSAATSNLSLRLISVTTDEPVYWPDEEVFLKVLIPSQPKTEVKITVTKKDATPNEIGSFTLNDSGMLVKTIASGKKKKLEPGEYSIEVATKDGRYSESTTYSVVEGALGALSFAYEFEQITDPAKLEKAKGGWYFGNASGVGKRWGNGLNVKNEIRYLNQPFSGKAKIATRCYLPGCNGVEAGQPIEKEITNGTLEAVLEVGGHSGPFGIDVITDKGSVSYVFGKSGHVERQAITVSGNLGNVFAATLAPYENTTAVYGRDIFITKVSSDKDDAVELMSVIADNKGEIQLIARKELSNPKLFVVHPDKGDVMKTEEISLGKKLDLGKRLFVKCSSPYSYIAIGGFVGDKLFEGWAIAFTESAIDVEINGLDSGAPARPFDLEIITKDRTSGRGIAVSGILEVFDNRVQSKSAKDPLVSAVGDSIREFSNYLVSWRDYTGIDEDKDYDKKADFDGTKSKGLRLMEKEEIAAAPSLAKPSTQQPRGSSEVSTTAIESSEEQETIREGEKKVVYCGIVTTNGSGYAKLSVDLPPQAGRCKARFVAIAGYEYAEKVKDIDVKKGSYIEVSLQTLVIPGALIHARAVVVNDTQADISLLVTGAGLEKDLTYGTKPGVTELEVPVAGIKYGKISFRLKDKNGKSLDARELEIKNVGTYPVTFSDIMVSDGKPITIPAGKRFAMYAGPGLLLQGMVNNIVTSMYSWFGHAEALSSAACIRAILLASIDAKIIGDEGKRDTIKSDLVKTVKDLYEAFYDKGSKLFFPYPGMAVNDLWSLWTSKSLSKTVVYLESSSGLKDEFKDTIKLAREMVKGVKETLKKKNINTQELGQYDFDKEQDVIPIEIDGKVVFKVVTDNAVSDWFVKKMAPLLDIPNAGNIEELSKKYQKALDTFRFLKSFERAGVFYYLSINAKALYLGKSAAFGQLFNRIAKGVILTQEPGIIQGPALLGGVYSSPVTIANFFDLLLLMARDKKFEKTKVQIDGKDEKLGSVPLIVEPRASVSTIKSDEYTIIRIDDGKTINMYDYIEAKPFFTASIDKISLKTGDRAYISITLDSSHDPSEYYTIVAAPSVLSIKQNDDLLSDYKGRLIYGQRSGGGEKIQLITAPFRGTITMNIEVEASQSGESEGFVLVRHISNPDIMATVKLPKVKVE